MSSPERERSATLSSSPRTITNPNRDGSSSPVRRRRSDSHSDVGTDFSIPRLSPTLSRAHNPNDPEHRERQRTLDVDMALHLSRARQNSESTVPSSAVPSSPTVASPFHSLSAQVEHHPSILGHPNLPSFSEGEEREFEVARDGGAGSTAPTLDVDTKSDFHFTSRSEPNLRSEIGGLGSGSGDGPTPSALPHLSMGQDPELLYSDRVASQGAPGGPDESEPFLPMYQPTRDSVFDFATLEEFARDEKRRLGLETPAAGPSTHNTLRWASPNGAGPSTRRQMASSATAFEPSAGRVGESAVADTPPSEGQETSNASSSSTMPRIRHRKISQSQPTPRTGRLGKKTALFEGAAGAPPPTLGIPPGGTAPSAMSSFENIFGNAFASAAPPPGIQGHTPGGGHHDRPYRFSFYSNALSATIHARSLSELPAEGQSFEDLFLATTRPTLSDPKGANGSGPGSGHPSVANSQVGTPNPPSVLHEQSTLVNRRVSGTALRLPGMVTQQPPMGTLGEAAPGYSATAPPNGGLPGGASAGGVEANTWWLDVLNPTDEEMKMLSKVFSIHPLTTEDILMEETREKIELFRNYYLVCFRGFDQDPYSPTYLEPLNMYIIVFREGTLSFHFRSTPHPQNVRRRIKQLKDYISVTSDWISYALIDDITDAFGPLIQSIEYEVDSIDELVLILKEAEQSDMLRRIGTCRKKVMGLLRLMGNKADVVKGLAKRCNENWRVAPTSDIGLYLSDIQDHLITMTQNLNHYEKILSRSHSNYLAQISIEMTEANNQINDVLSKMTALGTVLIPMNLVTGLWGMNVLVPGQDGDSLTWFVSILAGLIAFAAVGGYVTFRLMASR